MVELSHVIFATTIISFVLFQFNLRRASPVLAIINRWLRWFIFSTGGAFLATQYELVDRPYWIVAVSFFLLWFLGETLYNWLAIQALSVSPLPLFPKFSANTSGEEWPTHPRFLKVRDWLRAQGFHHVQALCAEVAPEVYLRVAIYQDRESQIRAQITFLPQPSGALSMCITLSTQTKNGYRYVTDNLYLPFAGFYPENWFVERNPWRRSLSWLLKRHQRRLADAGETLEVWNSDPLTDLNAQQHELEQVNTELGFLAAHADREDFGKMTFEGRYRVWKEIWLLNYLGLSTRYQ